MKKLNISAALAERTIPELLQEQAIDRPDMLHAIFPDRTLTFAQLDAQAQDWARAFYASGIRPGDHVATLMPNCASWLPVYYGALYCGAVLVALNARYKRRELAYTLAHSRARILVATDSFAEHVDYGGLLGDVFPELASQTTAELALASAPDLKNIVMCDGRSLPGMLSCSEFLAAGQAVDPTQALSGIAARTVDDTAAIVYTSGTTSNPKGCELTHASIQNSWSTFARLVDLKPGESVWMPMPFFHTGGIGPMTALLSCGAAFITQPHYEAAGVVDLIERYRTEHLYPGFPQLAFGVIEHPRFDRERFSHIRCLVNVGPPAMQTRIEAMLPTGAVLVNLFGMTEGSGIVAFTPLDATFEVRAETAGLPPPHTDIQIIDPDTGAPCADGTSGEIQFRGGGRFKGYFADPDATRAAITPDGWFKTGDRGVINAGGYLVYLGRLKDMLKVGGENVAAAEIEAFVQGLDAVRMVQVIGMPDDRMGEVPVAFIERVDGQSLTEADVISACDGQLARWKVPRRVVFVTEWPMSATKVQKFRLAELLGERENAL